jgi:DNA-directed RNA polymerase specialized sigma24 family protein
MRKTRREVPSERLPETFSHDRPPDPDLEKALADLSIEARTVVVLRHYLDMSYDQIGDAMKIPASAD